ncbi:MAG: hypothetical protein J7K33_09830 [Candidatus Marinimicrobia bacterium]|nr:hypothetical protein [Candidatus Neomarinimicrobiota bacterium]
MSRINYWWKNLEGGEPPDDVQRHPEEEKPVMPETSETTEETHGGSESTDSIPDSPNPSTNSEMQQSGAEIAKDSTESAKQESENAEHKESAESMTETESTESETEAEETNENKSMANQEENTETENSETNEQTMDSKISESTEANQEDRSENIEQTNEQESSTEQSEEQGETEELSESEETESAENQKDMNENAEEAVESENAEYEESEESETNEASENTEKAEDSENENETDRQKSSTEQTEEHAEDTETEQGSEEETEEEEENEDSEDYEIEKQEDSKGRKNQQQCIEFTKQKIFLKALIREFTRMIYRIAENRIKVRDFTNPTNIDMKLVLRRRFFGRTLNQCKVKWQREAIVLMVDNSGSMKWLTDILMDLVAFAMERGDIELYLVPNGSIQSYYDRKQERFLDICYYDFDKGIWVSKVSLNDFKNRVIVYIGDYDGADTPVILSRHNKVYWICTETRYEYFYEHSWVSVREEDFRGLVIKWSIYSEEDYENKRQYSDFLESIKRIKPGRKGRWVWL